MIEVTKHEIILQKTVLDFESEGILNPAVIREGNDVHLFYRAVAKNNYSTIGYCRLSDALTVKERLNKPIIVPQFDYESQGIEDPRIVKIEEVYYLTYTAYDGVNALGALATSEDLKYFEKHGIIVPQLNYDEFNHLTTSENSVINVKYTRFNNNNHAQARSNQNILVWDKNVIFFPRKINNKLYFLHCIKPDIQIVGVNNLQELTKEFWKEYLTHLKGNIVLASKYEHEVSYIGGGCPPIETADGWLVIYHGVYDTTEGYVYCACAALLNLENPKQEIARLPYPLFKPDREWELNGEVNNVCFPTGTALFGDTLYIYYGAADECIACASISLSALLAELSLNINKNE
jgi:predicted GH43/DUF377 family glycosyl hydrolase